MTRNILKSIFFTSKQKIHLLQMLNEYLAKDGAYVRYSIHESTLFSCNFILCYSITVNRIQAYDLLQNLFFFFKWKSNKCIESVQQILFSAWGNAKVSNKAQCGCSWCGFGNSNRSQWASLMKYSQVTFSWISSTLPCVFFPIFMWLSLFSQSQGPEIPAG